MNEAQARALFEPYYPYFGKCIGMAWDDYSDQYSVNVRAIHSSRTKASILHDHMLLHAWGVFQNVEGVGFLRSRGYHWLNFRGQAIVRFKKLDKRGRPSNYRTAQVKAILDGLPLMDLPPAVRLVAGYQPDPLGSGLMAILIVAPTGNGLAFKLRVDKSEGAAPMLPMPEITPPPVPPTEVRPKGEPKKKKRQDQEGNDAPND